MDDPQVAAILNAMTGEQRLRNSMRLYWSARGLRAAGLRSLHPDWPEEKIQKEVRDTFLFMRKY